MSMKPTRPLSIVEAMEHRDLLGGLPAFADLATWRVWIVAIKAAHGIPLDPDELTIFRRHTGRQHPRPGGYPELVCIVGVQSGKSRIAGALAAWVSITAEPGTHALLLGQDHRGAMRVLLRNARQPFETLPAFRAEVVRETADTLELRNGVSLSAYPCRPHGVRGIRACVLVIDELAFFTATDGRPTDTEMLRVARGRVATTGGKIIVLSSPYGQSGALWDLYRQHHGREDSDVLVWQASAPDMNPTLPKDYLERMAKDDPDAYRSEVLGEFRAGVASLFDPTALEAVVVPGRRELPPLAELVYRAFVDPSGGRSDAFTLAIGHRAGHLAVVDVARGWKPPLNPAGVVEEAAALLKLYGVGTVTGDRYAGEWPREAFRSHGVSYDVAESPKSDLYLGLLAAVNSASVELPEIADLLRLGGRRRHPALHRLANLSSGGAGRLERSDSASGRRCHVGPTRSGAASAGPLCSRLCPWATRPPVAPAPAGRADSLERP